MDRRQALKIMGTGLAASVISRIAFATHAAVVKDRSSRKNRLVFYFTATGNSLFVAKQLADNPLSIPQELKKDSLEYSADEIGFVFPDYAAAAPVIVRDFLLKARFKAEYMFSVITYGNASVCVSEWWDRFARENGVSFDYVRPILMVDNYLPVFDMNEQNMIDKHTDESLAAIISDISSRKSYVEPSDMGRFNEEMLDGMREFHFTMTSDRLLRLDADRCVGCMTCSKVCPHGNFSMTDNGLSFSGRCEFCLACVHSCPQKALHLERERNREARFRHPDISLNEIIRSNIQ
ncbi:MAG: EFR1 family ferrodoxin [Candidatus Cryptobacteroides sp.]